MSDEGAIVAREEDQSRIRTADDTDRRILETLAKLGGGKIGDDDIVSRGTQLVLPETMSPKAAIKFLKRHLEQQETAHEFSRSFKFRPHDGANAVDIALRRVTGSAGLGQTTYGFFSKFPPEFITIETGVGESKQVPWGMLAVPLFEGMLSLGSVRDPEHGELFHISLEAPKKFRVHIEGFFDVVQSVLEEESIYKGKAVDGAGGFLDLSANDPSKVVYSASVGEQLEANIWSLLRYSQTMRDHGLPLKRAVLTHGPYGSGKTLAAMQTAQVAVDNDWTFLYCRPGKDDLASVMQTARLYQPAVVFFEDVDEVAQPDDERTDSVTRLLDLFDGITAKGTELVAVMTTNHVEKIHKGMVRPGRLDAVIEIAGLDPEGVRRLVEVTAGDSLQADIDWPEVVAAMSGYLPAFIREAVDRARRYALATRGSLEDISTADLVAAAEGLRDQLDLMERADEARETPTIDRAFREAFGDGFLSRVNEVQLLNRENDSIGSLGNGKG